MGTSAPTPSRGSNLTISFGLVNVGVKYAPLVREQRTSGKFLDPETKGPVTQQYVNEKGTVVKPVTGYPHGEGFVVLDPEDVKRLESERDPRLDLRAFIEPEQVDPLYFEKSYLVWPVKGQEAGYDLICSVLAETGRFLVGTTVIRKSTKIIVLRYGQGCLLAQTCTYDANVAWYDHGLVTQAHMERPQADDSMVSMALDVFSGLEDSFDFAAVSDEYDERLRQAIDAAAAGLPMPKAPEVAATPVVDLMEALKATVAAAGQPKAKAAKRSSKKKAAA